MSGASSRARPGGRIEEVTTRSVPGSPLALSRHARQAGQDVLGGEPFAVGGAGDQGGGQRGGPQDAGLGDVLADQGVHQGGLARPGGAADDGQQRRVDGAQTRDQVVVELAGQLAQRPPVGLDIADREREQITVEVRRNSRSAPSRPSFPLIGSILPARKPPRREMAPPLDRVTGANSVKRWGVPRLSRGAIPDSSPPQLEASPNPPRGSGVIGGYAMPIGASETQRHIRRT